MARQAQLFPKPPRKKPRVMMRAIDAGGNFPGENYGVHWQCVKCDHDDGWHGYKTFTESKQGEPCPQCNKEQATAGEVIE